jgi:pyridoxine kinase
MKIESLKDTCLATKKLHELGTDNVVITTLSLPLKDIPQELLLDSSSNESLYCFTSQKTSEGYEQYLISFPTYQGYFTGTGDLFSSLVVARLQETIEKQNVSLIEAVYKVVCSVNLITKKTYEYQKSFTNGASFEIESKPNAAQLVRKCELQLIKGKKAIEQPELIGKNIIKKFKV